MDGYTASNILMSEYKWSQLQSRNWIFWTQIRKVFTLYHESVVSDFAASLNGRLNGMAVVVALVLHDDTITYFCIEEISQKGKMLDNRIV